MRIFIALLVLVVLFSVSFVPIAQAIVNLEADKIVAILSDESIPFASAWAQAIRMSNKLFGEYATKTVLSSNATKTDNESFAFDRVYRESADKVRNAFKNRLECEMK